MGAAGNPLGYNGYGCWCGSGNRGELVLDETDRCCQIHDICWGLAEKFTPGCKPFWRWYDYNSNSGYIQCTDEFASCDRDTCLCDKAAVECFARHRPTTYDYDHDNWKGICEKTHVAPEDDPQWCPQTWEKEYSYRAGSYVSMNGIAYRAFYWANPGQSPQKHSSTSQGTGSVWQILGKCRRSYVDSDYASAYAEAEAILNELYFDRKSIRLSK